MAAKKAVRVPSSLVLTNSSITDFLSCRRRFKLKYEDLLSKKAIATPLIVGDIVHDGLAALLLGEPIDAVMPKITKRIDEARKGNLDDLEGFESDATVIEGMLRGWDTNRGHLKGAVPWDWGGKKWVEQKFSWYQPDGTQITGKIDAVVIRKDGPWIVEHKTAGRIDVPYIDRLSVDSQMSMYFWAIAKIYGKPPTGIIYNVIRKPGIRQKKTETLVQFQERLLSELTTDKSYFYQTLLYRNEEAVKEFDHSLVTIAEDVKLERQRGSWHMNPSQCAPIGRVCPMLNICANGKTPIVMGLYHKRDVLHPELEVR